jgi:hypothetical protein
MRTIDLNATRWHTVLDIYHGFYDAISAAASRSTPRRSSRWQTLGRRVNHATMHK